MASLENNEYNRGIRKGRPIGNYNGIAERSWIKMKTIKYHEIERILGSYLVSFKGRIYRTKENIQTFPDTITLLDNGLSEDEFENIRQDIITALNGGN